MYISCIGCAGSSLCSLKNNYFYIWTLLHVHMVISCIYVDTLSGGSLIAGFFVDFMVSDFLAAALTIF